MLRVRPLVHTADTAGAAGFLEALGLHPANDRAMNGTSAVFDAGSGRVAVHGGTPGAPTEGTAEGTTTLAFDVADVREFARRTREAGTPVELLEEDSGVAARITASDGTSFLARTGPRETGAPASPLTVLVLWSTPDVGTAVRVLEDIGARPRTGSDTGMGPDFTAKNGGLVAVHAAERIAIDLAFEYDGDVRTLVGALTATGCEPVVVDEGHGLSLRVRAPWGAEVLITQRPGGLPGGYPVH